MYLPFTHSALLRRQDSSSDSDSSGGMGTAATVVIAVVISLFVLLAAYVSLRILRRRHPNPKYIPTPFLKSRWRAWTTGSRYGRISKPTSSSTREHGSGQADDISYQPSTEITTSTSHLDRGPSIRSIITLPPYHSSPLPSEQSIAREGERAGLDVVVSLPETEDEVEARREAEMDSLFQIRQARRRERDERDERRRQRTEAREQGDWNRLEQLRIESVARQRARERANTATSAGSSNTDLLPNADFLVAEHTAQREARRRDRRISSVSYADLGLARHDGSRIRANSTESDDRPLLESAAGMGNDGRSIASRQSSPFRFAMQHHRGPSVGSNLSIESMNADMDVSRSTTRDGQRSSSDGVVELTPQESPEAGSGGSEPYVPPIQPPRYEEASRTDDEPGEEAPPYSSPVRERGELGGPSLPQIRPLPAIEVSSVTPSASTAGTPVERE